MITTNFHTHTVRCGHAEGADETYIQEAIKAGITTLGFSDHAPWVKIEGEHHGIRMAMEQMDDYVESMNRLKRQYAARLDLKIGLEAEYYPERLDQLKALCARHDLDYLVLGNHFHTLEAYGRYYGGYADLEHLFEHYIADTQGALASGLYSLYAHPDLFVRSLKSWTKEAEACARTILQMAKDHHIPVEYNLGGLRFGGGGLTYPYEPFWKLAAEIGNDVIIGIDAHSPYDLTDDKTKSLAEANLKRLGITPLKTLPLIKPVKK